MRILMKLRKKPGIKLVHIMSIHRKMQMEGSYLHVMTDSRE